jgi:hypothetical protein
MASNVYLMDDQLPVQVGQATERAKRLNIALYKKAARTSSGATIDFREALATFPTRFKFDQRGLAFHREELSATRKFWLSPAAASLVFGGIIVIGGSVVGGLPLFGIAGITCSIYGIANHQHKKFVRRQLDSFDEISDLLTRVADDVQDIDQKREALGLHAWEVAGLYDYMQTIDGLRKSLEPHASKALPGSAMHRLTAATFHDAPKKEMNPQATPNNDTAAREPRTSPSQDGRP